MVCLICLLACLFYLFNFTLLHFTLLTSSTWLPVGFLSLIHSLSHFYCFALRRFFVFPYFCKSMLPQWVHTRQITTHDWLICMAFFSKNTVNDLELSSSSVWTLWSNNNQYYYLLKRERLEKKANGPVIFLFFYSRQD